MNELWVVCGVAGSGKSAVGNAVVEEIRADHSASADALFLDADDFHPPENVAKMSSGTPLTDDDRKPWLEAITSHVTAHFAKASRRTIIVLACSALKRAYRIILSSPTSMPSQPYSTTFFYLRVSKADLLARLKARANHFFRVDMLDSQFAALEEPTASVEEKVVILDIRDSGWDAEEQHQQVPNRNHLCFLKRSPEKIAQLVVLTFLE
ncbi:hypothetical protein BJ742DRAFT_795279 [Cladochytrium replicatum]|nr:hypothetical protein BJ742DRAFT_795279 [Cladochytrium replicatum]